MQHLYLKVSLHVAPDTLPFEQLDTSERSLLTLRPTLDGGKGCMLLDRIKVEES